MTKQNEKKQYFLPVLLIIVASIALNAPIVQAQEFRKLNRIARPPATKKTPAVKPNAAVVKTPTQGQTSQILPVSRAVAEKAAQMLVDAWNSNTLESVLAENFFDRSRLLDAMGSNVPRDAALRVLAIQDVQTLKQKYETGASGRVLNSTVSITLRTQITFNDETGKFQRLEGINECIMHIRQTVRS